VELLNKRCTKIYLISSLETIHLFIQRSEHKVVSMKKAMKKASSGVKRL